jgi:hypothetical protein
VGDDEDGALVVDQVLLQPGDAFGVKVVGRFVEKQHVGLLKQELAERHAAAFPAREGGDIGIVRRAAERVHRDADGRFKLPQVLRVNLVLQGGHLVCGLVRVVHRQFVVAFQDLGLLGHAQHDVFLGGELRVKLRLLREVADLGALGGPGLTFEVLVHPGHDLQEGRLARAVDADDADLHAGQEVQVDVLKAGLAAGVGLGDVLHVVNILIAGHGALLTGRRFRDAGGYVAIVPGKGNGSGQGNAAARRARRRWPRAGFTASTQAIWPWRRARKVGSARRWSSGRARWWSVALSRS